MQVNDIIHGFRLLRQEQVKEAASDALVFQHVKSGARLHVPGRVYSDF